jgi:hypothetical protein
MNRSLSESYQIVWEYLERTGELGDGAIASRFLGDTAATVSSRVRTSG